MEWKMGALLEAKDLRSLGRKALLPSTTLTPKSRNNTDPLHPRQRQRQMSCWELFQTTGFGESMAREHRRAGKVWVLLVVGVALQSSHFLTGPPTAYMSLWTATQNLIHLVTITYSHLPTFTKL
jgi:hypothetical protein